MKPQDFFQEGFDAFGQGKTRSDNPYYLTDPKAAHEWSAGWLDAWDDEACIATERANDRPCLGEPK